MIFSRACEYGIRSVLYLAINPKSGPVLVRDIAGALKLPFPFLAKIIRTLTLQGLVHSVKGPGGGVTLAKPAEEMTLLQVVEAIDGLDLTKVCVMGISDCSEEHACPLHEQWGAARKQIVVMLENQSVAEITEQMKAKNYLLVLP